MIPRIASAPVRRLAPAVFPVCAFLAGVPGSARADTEVCGTYELATEWTARGSPYLVTGDIFIPATSRLRIGPGVVVRFAKPRPCELEKRPIDQEDWSDSAYTGIKAEGTLYALGTEERPVVFEPADSAAGPIGWDGLRLKGQRFGMAEIGFAVFRGANQAVRAEQAGFFVHHSLFAGNNTGILAVGRGDVGVVNCAFIGNLSAGIAIRKSGPRVANSLFAGNRGYGIWADGRPGMQARYNAFWDNREAHCRRCPFDLLDTLRKNAHDDPCDAYGNLVADPVFIGSPGHAAAREADPEAPTPAHLVKDPEMARLEAESRARQAREGKNGAEAENGNDGKKGKRRKEYKPLGQGPYVLSEYSKLIDAGHPGKEFRDRDGTRNDIGLHGGPLGRVSVDPF